MIGTIFYLYSVLLQKFDPAFLSRICYICYTWKK